MAAAALAAIYPQALRADEFTAADVLAWKHDQQDWYFYVSVGMAGVVAAQNVGNVAECIDTWYFGSDSSEATANENIRETMERFPEYHPAGVIAAIIEKNCGSLTFK